MPKVPPRTEHDPKDKLPLILPTLYKSATKGANVEWTLTVTADAKGNGVIHTKWGRAGGKMQEGVEVIEEGKNLNKATATSPIGQAILEGKAAWQEKLDRRGYGQDTGATESKAKRAVLPMLAHTYEDYVGKVDFEPKAFMQIKFDGHRCLAFITPDSVKLFSRKGTDITNVPHVIEELKPLCKSATVQSHDLLIVDGELFTDEVPFEDLAGQIRRKTARGDEVLMQYHTYDLFIPSKPDMIFSERFRRLTILYQNFLADDKSLKLVDTKHCDGHDHLVAFRDECIADCHEGAILRLDAPYAPGDRSPNLLKCKLWKDEEFEVVGFGAGANTFKDKCIFECVTKDGKKFKVTSPGTAAEKQAYLKYGKDYIGKMLTVEYACYTRKGVPKQPQAKAFRSDL